MGTDNGYTLTLDNLKTAYEAAKWTFDKETMDRWKIVYDQFSYEPVRRRKKTTVLEDAIESAVKELTGGK